MKCIALNCENDSDYGSMVGELCGPCHQKLTTGEGDHGTSILFSKPATTMYEDVGMFHLKMGLPVAESFSESREAALSAIVRDPGMSRGDELPYRINFLFEELKEFIEGNHECHVPKMADALADLIWVALGTAHYLGLPFDRVWSEVRRANMEKRPWKEGDPIKPRNVKGLEVVKPDGWRAPDIEEAIWGSDPL